MLVVVKCGSDTERLAGEGKPGNRGKRDSQMILMNFIMRVNYNERFTPLDFDLFRKVYTLCGVHADYFEAVLMVSLLVLLYLFRVGKPLKLSTAGRRRHPDRS